MARAERSRTAVDVQLVPGSKRPSGARAATAIRSKRKTSRFRNGLVAAVSIKVIGLSDTAALNATPPDPGETAIASAGALAGGRSRAIVVVVDAA
jgi:hypothetical protein